MNSLKGGEASGAPPMRLSLLCLVLVVFLLPLNQHLFIEASGPSSADLKVSSLTSGSSSSSSRNSSRSRMHQVVVSKIHEISDGGRIARLEVSLQAPSGAAAEAQRGSASESSNLVRGFLTATLRGQQLEVNTPLFDGDPRSLATMLDAVLKEAEALGALRVLTAQDAGNSAAFVGHAYAGFLPVLFDASQQDACKVVWMAEASRRRRHQQRLKLKAQDVKIVPLARATEAQRMRLRQFCQRHGNTTIDEVLSSNSPPVCLFAMNQRGEILEAVIPQSVKRHASSPGVTMQIVGPHGTAVGSELLARLRGMAELDEVAGVVLPLNTSDFSRIHDAIEAGLMPVSFDRETISFSAKRTESERLFPYTVTNEGEAGEEQAEIMSEAWREEGVEARSRLPTEARQKVRGRWGRLVAQIKARGLIGGLKETPEDTAGAVAGDGVEGVSLKGLGVGVTTTLLLTMLILGLVPKRRRHTRTAASNLGMGVMSYEMLLVGQALHNHGGNDVVGVEATLPANGSLKFC